MSIHSDLIGASIGDWTVTGALPRTGPRSRNKFRIVSMTTGKTMLVKGYQLPKLARIARDGGLTVLLADGTAWTFDDD